MNRTDLFPTPLWHIDGAPQELVYELWQAAYRFKEAYISVKKSNEGGYQTPTLEWKDFNPQAAEYISKVVGDIFEFKVQHWWYNINGKGHWNHPHTHPDSDIALVWYLTDSDGLLHLLSPFPQRTRTEGNKVVGDYAWTTAAKGDILMFPSDLYHHVLPNPREEDRISISMNLRLS